MAFTPLLSRPPHFTYDADGNLTSDGRWNYFWDAENRLVSMAPSTTVGPQISLAFRYDWRGRRILKQVWSNATWNGAPTNSTAFLYDAWNPVAELNTLNAPATPTLYRSYVWGLDLSGSAQGAGGVGGLLEVNDPTNGVQFAAFDGNGNVAGLVSASSGASSAAYEYSPFGEVVRRTGPMAKTNPFRFSAKYQDDEANLVCYGYRYYNADQGRWLSRDPITEAGGTALYCLLANDPVTSVDADGRYEVWDTFHLNMVCGGWQVVWMYRGKVARKGKYYLVQQVIKWRWDDNCCLPPDDGDWKETEFYEAKEFTMDGDTWLLSDFTEMDPSHWTKGFLHQVVGRGKVFPADADIARDIASWGHQAPEAHDLPSTYSKPAWWDTGRFVDYGVRRAWENDWDCCESQHNFGTLHMSTQ